MLSSDKLFLRPPEPTDLDLLYRWENDPELWHVSDTLSPYSKHQIEEYLNDAQNDIFARKQIRFIICLQDSAEAIGTVDLFDFQPMHQRLAIGIFIINQHRQQGFAGETLELVIEYCRKALRIKQVWCQIPESNHPSIKLFESMGFELFGLAKEWIREENGSWEDVRLYQKLLG
jgi:diamine N-acetyltransferase